MIAKGDNGFDELRALLRTRQESVSYCVAPVTVDGGQRFVFLCYIGESTSGIKRGRAAMPRRMSKSTLMGQSARLRR